MTGSLHTVTTMKRARGVLLLVIYVTTVSGSRTCSEHCKMVKNNCTQDPGVCSLGCFPRYYGSTCNMTCDDNCENHTCQQRDGTCRCVSGYKFDDGACKYTQGVKCQSNKMCLSDMCLEVGREECLQGCKPGSFGKFCDQHCPSVCFCDKESGRCTSCKEGWYGSECKSLCGSDCKNKTGCDQLTGDCVQCVAGRYGSTCQSECSAGCANRDCDRDGRCVSGCSKGFYGHKCESPCPQFCDGALCDPTTGVCTQGCAIEVFGSFCNLTCVNCKGGDCDPGQCTEKWLPFAIGGSVLFIFVVIAVFMACCLKRMRDIMRDGVDLIGQNTAVQASPSHGSLLRSVGRGNTDNNDSRTDIDDTYNHLFDMKTLDATFSLANDDLETSSGYCTVGPFFHDLSHKVITGSDEDGSRGNDEEGLLSLCEGTDWRDIDVREAKAVVEHDPSSRPIEIVALRTKEEENLTDSFQNISLLSDDKTLVPESIKIVTLRPKQEEEGTSDSLPNTTILSDEEILNPELMQVLVQKHDDEVASESIQKMIALSEEEKLIPKAIQIDRDKEVINEAIENESIHANPGACRSIMTDTTDEDTGVGEAAAGCSSQGGDTQETQRDHSFPDDL